MVADANTGISEPILMAGKTEPRIRQWPFSLAQCAFWGGYVLLNMVFVSLFVPFHPIYLVINLILSGLLLLATSGLRELYRRGCRNWPLRRTIAHLLWVLPLTAIGVQLVLRLQIELVLFLLPDWRDALVPQSQGAVIGYILNTLIMLVLWTVLYLFISESRRRRNAELAFWQSQAALREAELHFLRSQINSHFLFNALNNVRALIREDPELSRQRLTQLSSLLRAILMVDQDRLISVEEEVAIVQGYLDLERLQFEQRLQFEWEIDDEALLVKVPPLLLQTLVENAVRHGIAGRAKGGCIGISVRKKDMLYITIRNPLSDYPINNKGQGVGLKNTRQRLHYLYHESATLSVQIREIEAVTELEIPL